MPKKEINNYIFYKIACDDCPDYIYIGSTVNFIRRKSAHKKCCNDPNHKSYNIKVYQVIREYGGWTNWNMIIIDKAEQLTLTNSRIKEEQLRKEYNGNLNSHQAFTTDDETRDRQKEYREQNKDKISEQQKGYYEENKEKIKERHKEKITCICGCKISRHNLNTHIKTDKHINLMKLQNQ